MFPFDFPETPSCDPCAGRTCADQRNSPRGPFPSNIAKLTGTGTVTHEIMYHGEQAQVNSANCLRIPLKSGGSLSLAWIHGAGQGALDAAYENTWKPAGAGAVFAFLPIVNNNDVADNERRRMSDRGVIVYKTTGDASSSMPYMSKKSSPLAYFTEYDWADGVYFEYWDNDSINLNWGRPNRRYDTRGNQLFYNYSPNAGGQWLLRSITGDIGGNLVPYFEYADETIDATRFAPITKIYLLDQDNPSNSRTAYFEYLPETYRQFPSPLFTQMMHRIVNPNGCVHQIDVNDTCCAGIDQYGIWHQKRELDAEGYQTYYWYGALLDNNSKNLELSIEANGLVTYFGLRTSPLDGNLIIQKGRDPHYRWYKLASGRFPCIFNEVDPLKNTTYYSWYEDGGNNFVRPTAKMDALWNVTYYEYLASGNNEFALTRQLSAFNGAQTYFGYNPGTYDMTLQVGPRHTSTFPVATYYTYNEFRDRISRVDPLGSVTQYGRDNQGRISKKVDALGHSTYHNYGASTGNKDSTVAADGSVTYFGYSSFRELKRVVSPRWPEATFASFTSYYEYDQRGQRTKAIDALGKVTYYDWSARGDLIAWTDARGSEINFTYDSVRKPTRNTHLDAAGTILADEKYGYDLYKNRIRAQTALGNTTYFFFDAIDRVVAQKNALLNTVYFYYDRMSNLAATKNASGNLTYFFYDSLSRPVATRDALLNCTYFFYDLADNRTHVRDARLNSTYYFYDQVDRLKATQDAQGNATYFFSDASGNRTSATSARGFTTYFGYDELDRPKAVQDAVGNVTYFSYDFSGNLTRTVDARENATTSFYNTLDRPASVRDAIGNAAYYFYDSVGNRTESRDPRGDATYFFFDGLNRTKASRDALGNYAYFFYDSETNLTHQRNALLHTTYYAYDAVNRKTKVVNALWEKTYFQYDSVGNLTKVLDPNNNATQMRYDALNRNDATRLPDSGSSYFFYDSVSNNTKVVDPRGNATYYGYDSLNRLTAIQDMLGRNLYFEYDQVSNPLLSRDSEGSTCYHLYDAVNRKTNLTYTAAGASISASLRSAPYYVYDQVSNLTQMGDLWGLHRIAYDPLNRMTRHQFPNQNVVYFEYDQASNLTARVYPGSSGRAGAAYDALNRQIRVQAPSSATAYFAYDAVDNPTQRSLGNGAKVSMTYDAAERVARWRNSNKNGGALSYFDYTRDAKGLITKAFREATHTTYYRYDVNDRIVAEIWSKSGTPEVYAFRYAYDLTGNRIRARIKNGPSTVNTYYFYDKSNQLTVTGTTSAWATPTYYIYEKNGSLTNIIEPSGATYFAYNAAGLVARIRWRDASSTYFFYDGHLRRFAKVISGTATYFLWDGTNLLQELNADGSVKEEHTNVRSETPGIGQLVETRRPGQAQEKLYPVMDPRGSITKWIQSDGTTAFSSREYDAFGVIIANSGIGTWPGRFGYQGQVWLEIFSANGSQRLLLSPTRIYDSFLGRFLQGEPLLDIRPFSHYLYCDSNPVEQVDPTGRDPKQRDLLQRMINGNRLNNEATAIAKEFVSNDKYADDNFKNKRDSLPSKWKQEAAFNKSQENWKLLESMGVVDKGYVVWGPFDPSSPIEREGSSDPCTPKERWEKEQEEQKDKEREAYLKERERQIRESRAMKGPLRPAERGDAHYGVPDPPPDPELIRQSNAGRQMPSAPFYDTGGSYAAQYKAGGYGPSDPREVNSFLLTAIPIFGPLMIIPTTIRDMDRIARGDPKTIASYGFLPIKIVTTGIGPVPGAPSIIRDMGFPVPRNVFYPQGGIK